MEAEANDIFSTDYKLENRVIKNVMVGKEQGRNARIILVLDGEKFPALTPQGEKIMTNNVGIDVTQIMAQFGAYSPYIRIANSYIGGVGVIPTQIVSMALIGGTVTINRLFKAKGEKRQDSEEVYSSNIFKSEVTNFVPNVDDISKEMLSFELKNLSEKAGKASETLIEKKPQLTSRLGLTLVW